MPDGTPPTAISRLAGARASGLRLSRADYLARFREEYPRCSQVDKLEAGQRFREPGYAPWEAAQRGNWGEALRLAEEERPTLARQYEEATAQGRSLRRVRLVELPPSDYVLWEMSILRLRAELGEEIGVITSAGITATDGWPGSNRSSMQHPPPAHMPELVVLGATALYELRYTQEGDLDGALRHTDPELIDGCRQEIGQLLTESEELLAFHDRVTAPLLAARSERRPADER